MSDGIAKSHAPAIGRRGIMAGAAAAFPVLLAVAPFGVIYGAVARDAGLDLLQTMALTLVVIAGASQLAALQVLTDGAPAFVAILTGAVVNLRMAMYSASLSVHLDETPLWTRALAATMLHDHSFALSVRRYQERRDERQADRIGFFLGVGSLTAAVWVLSSWVGATLGERVLEGRDLTFIVPVTFVALAAPMLRGPAQCGAAVSAAGLSLLLAGLPYGTGLLVAAMAGISVGLFLEPRMKGHRHD